MHKRKVGNLQNAVELNINPSMSPAPRSTVHKKIATHLIVLDELIQSRVSLSAETITQYQEDVCNGLQFDPIVIYHDGIKYWLADGFHRTEASKQAGLQEVEAEVRSGTRRDAILYSVSANGKHGLPRNSNDKRKSVVLLLSDAEWSKWSNVQIASRCIVSESFVRKVRIELTSFSAKLDQDEYAANIGVSETIIENAILNSKHESHERIVVKGNTQYLLNIQNLANRSRSRNHSQESSVLELVPTPSPPLPTKADATETAFVEEPPTKVIPFSQRVITQESRFRDQEEAQPLYSSSDSFPAAAEGQMWRLGESHLLFCGSPDAPIFRQQLPATIAISLLFPRSDADLRLELMPAGTMRQFVLFDPLQQEWDLQVFRDVIERTIDNCTSPQDPVVMLFLPDPVLLLLMLEMDSPCFCAEPNPQRCAAAIEVWNQTASRNLFSPAKLIESN
jgi:hypothetical protein